MSVRVFGLDLSSPQTTLEVVIANAGSKALVMGLSAICSIASTRLVIEHFGVAAYAQYGLLATMAMLVPFADLGLGAAIMNAVAEADSPSSLYVRRVLVTAFRVLLCSGLCFICIAVVVTILDWWPRILGDGLLPGGNLAALLCVVVFAATLPLGVGQRLLNGLGLNHLQIRVQLLAAPCFLIAIMLLVATHAPMGSFLAIFSYLSSMVVAAVSLWVAAARVRPQISRALREVPKLTTVRGAKAMHVAWPMLAQLLILPIAMQSDRVLLSHFGSTDDLAQYNLAAQLFGMILLTINSAGIALWPIFARSRARDEVRSPLRLAMGFFAGTIILCGVVVLLLPLVVPIISDGAISMQHGLVLAFIAFVSIEALAYPVGMYMTDARGLRFQLIPIVALAPINLTLSWVLIGPLGAAGPVLGSAVAVGLCQVIPNSLYVRRELVRRRSSLSSQKTALV